MLDTFQVKVSEQVVPLVLMIGFLSAGFVAAAVFSWLHTRQTERVRSGENVETFVTEMQTVGYDPDIARLVYTFITEQEHIAFPIEPEDRLDEDLGIADAQKPKILHQLLIIAGRDIHSRVLAMPLHTVADLIRAIQSSPFVSQLAA